MPLAAEQIAQLVDRHAVPLALWVGRSGGDAQDIVQEAFCRLAIQDPPPDKPVAWLYRVARNLAESERLARTRRRARERWYASPEHYVSDPADRLLQAELVAAVEQLDSELRQVLVARLWGQMTLEEIASLCNVSVATASRRFSEAIKTLRQKAGGSPSAASDATCVTSRPTSK